MLYKKKASKGENFTHKKRKRKEPKSIRKVNSAENNLDKQKKQTDKSNLKTLKTKSYNTTTLEDRKKETKPKNSVKGKNVTSCAIKECPTIQATEEDFRNPLTFFESLWSGKNEQTSTGIIKILPPKSWKEANSHIFNNFYLPNFTKSEKKIETRIQNLQELINGKKFEFIRNYTFKEYRNKANEIEKEFYPEKNSEIEKEKDYWEICFGKTKTNKTNRVLYAADLSYQTFLDKSDFSKIEEFLKTKKTWNLSSLYKLKDSFFQFLKEKPSNHISGLTLPWVYFGMLFSTFCWHVEDLYMYSVNYMYYGGPKIWYSIPPNEKEKLDNYVKGKIKKNDPNILHKLILLVNPKELAKNGISVYKAIQNPGEIIFTLPKAYHCGFSTAFNISEAVNLATYKWTQFGFKACEDYKSTLSKTPVFSIEWLLYNNMKNLNNFIFTNEEELNKLIQKFKNILTLEKRKRKNFENFLNSRKIKFEIFNTKDDEDYEKSECNFCTNYGFFSYVKCSLCDFICCLDHREVCECKNPIMILYYRFKDLEELDKLIKKKI